MNGARRHRRAPFRSMALFRRPEGMSLEMTVYARLQATKGGLKIDRYTGLGSNGAVSPIRFNWATNPHRSGNTQNIGSGIHELLQIGTDIVTPGWAFFSNLSIDSAEVIDLGVQGLVLTAPGAPTVTPQGTPATTHYGYKVSAIDASGETLVSSEGTTTTGAASLTGVNFNRLTWAAVVGATAYKVYGRTSGGAWLYMATVNAPTVQYDDTGVDTPAGAVPSQNTTGFIRFGCVDAGGIALLKLATASIYGKARSGTPRLDWDIADSDA